MCGIFCDVRRGTPRLQQTRTEELIRQRGPDSYRVQGRILQEPLIDESEHIHLIFAASVLSLRGETLTPQPISFENDEGVLCWNGEAWKYGSEPVNGSDTSFVVDRLYEASVSSLDFHKGVLEVFSKIRGPFAFIYYNKIHRKIYFGRDCLGRRSLLRATMPCQSLVLSSVADLSISSYWEEIEANGIYVVDLLSQVDPDKVPFPVACIPYSTPDENLPLPLPWGKLNMTLPDFSTRTYERVDMVSCKSLYSILDKAVQLRLTSRIDETIPTVAILFSGGLDCTVLARIAHDHLNKSMGIDLLNVAFENPRIHKNLAKSISPYELCPDRITARQSLAELQEVCPDRKWNLICIDIPYSESTQYKDEIMQLIYPHNTEMDISIAMALFFAARGPTQSKFLLSGLGADELFGGYQRHTLAYNRGGYKGLLNELNLDISRLGKRNLGRDDRVISRWGKEARFPYLDEDVVAWALGAAVWEKVGFDFERNLVDEEVGEDGHVELDDKLVVRCIAKRLGIGRVAEEKKRAIQFGTRSAKMESGRTKGTEKVG